MNTFKTLFTGVLCSLLLAFTANAQDVSKWASTNTDAAQAFTDLVHEYPQQTTDLFAWDAQHPDHSKELAKWGAANAQLSFQNFYIEHPDWADLKPLKNNDIEAIRGFLKWSRAFKTEATSLMSYSGGLQWESQHLPSANTATPTAPATHK